MDKLKKEFEFITIERDPLLIDIAIKIKLRNKEWSHAKMPKIARQQIKKHIQLGCQLKDLLS